MVLLTMRCDMLSFVPVKRLSMQITWSPRFTCRVNKVCSSAEAKEKRGV